MSIEKTLKATKEMREKVLGACATMQGRMTDPCTTVAAQIALGDERAARRRAEGYLMGDYSFLKDAIYVNPYSEEYCIQSNFLGRFSPELQAILKYRFSGHAFLCQGKSYPVSPPKLLTRDEVLKTLAWYTQTHHPEHPVHTIYAELEKRMAAQKANNKLVSIVSAGEELLKNARKNHDSKFNLNLLTIACEKNRLAYAQELIDVNIPVQQALQITSRFSQKQAAILKDSFLLKGDLSSVSSTLDKSYETLNQDEIDTLAQLQTTYQLDTNFVMNLLSQNKAEDILAGKTNTTISSYKSILEKLASCTADNAKNIMDVINNVLEKTAPQALAMSVATSAFACAKHAEKLATPMLQLTDGNNSVLQNPKTEFDITPMVVISGVAVTTAIALGCLLNKPIRRCLKRFFSAKQTAMAAPDNAVVEVRLNIHA